MLTTLRTLFALPAQFNLPIMHCALPKHEVEKKCLARLQRSVPALRMPRLLLCLRQCELVILIPTALAGE